MEEVTKEELANLDIHIFNEVYEIKNEQGKKLDFHNHAFLWDIYSDFSPFQAVRKAAQIGFTTTAIIKSLWLAHNKKMDMIYTMPTYSDVNTLVTSKVNRIIEQNPILAEWVSRKDTIEQKRVGNSVIYYRGTWSEREALSTSSDLNIHDEVDRSNLKVVDQYYSRLQHSDYRWQWLFSNPSVPEIGVDKLWNRSDQKHWFVACSNCNKKQYMIMDNILKNKKGEFYYGCTKCQTELDRTQGEWVARWRDKTYHETKNPNGVNGYWISLLMAPWVSADTVKNLEATKPADFFANFVLGIPYTGAGNIVTKDVIVRNLTDLTNDQSGRIVIGVDPGIDIRYVIGNEKGLFYYGECKDYKELEDLMKRWKTAIMVIDSGGDLIASRELREKYKNRIFLAYYRQDRKSEELFSWNDDEGSVTIDRNRTIQLVIDELTDRRIPIYGNETDWYNYYLHWSHIYRVSEEDNLGQMRTKWQRSDRDDWVHSTVYWRAGMDRFMSGAGEIINIQDSIGEVGYTTDPTGKKLDINLFQPKRKY